MLKLERREKVGKTRQEWGLLDVSSVDVRAERVEKKRRCGSVSCGKKGRASGERERVRLPLMLKI